MRDVEGSIVPQFERDADDDVPAEHVPHGLALPREVAVRLAEPGGGPRRVDRGGL